MKNTTSTELEMEDIEQLLPWYATGRLKDGERALVEKGLAEFPELHRQLAIIRAEIDQTVGLNEKTPRPVPGAAERFMAALAQEPKPRAAAHASVFESLREWLAGRMMVTPRWAVIAAVLVVALQSGVLGALFIERMAGGYYTAGGDGGQQADGTLVLVRFSDAANLAMVNGKLAALGITIVDGPKAGGIFTLRIGPDEMPAEGRDRKIAALKAAAGIIGFVGAIQ